jgi:putative phosphoesterase
LKIGVISDTHLNGVSPRLEWVAEKYFKDADLMVHAGDLHAMEVLDVFRGKEVIAVAGNRDRPEVKQRLSQREMIKAKGFKIGLTHGWGSPFRLDKRVSSRFEGVHCVIYGHSHRTFNREKGGILFFNPGAFTGGIFSLWRNSIGILTLDREIKGEIVWL